MNIICVSWGNKYTDYIPKLKKQIQNNCSVDYNFHVLDDLVLPTHWDKHFIPDKNFFWAYRKFYMFNEDLFPFMKGDEFLYLDLDLLIHQDLKYFQQLDMSKPYIVRGWWNDIKNCRKNFGRIKSTPLNSSVIRWNRGQLKPIYDHVEKYKEVIFFTYRTIYNYLAHHFYDVWDESRGYFKGFPKGDIYSWYKGNVYPVDMEEKLLRPEYKICLFNNSAAKIDEHMNEIEEIKELW